MSLADLGVAAVRTTSVLVIRPAAILPSHKPAVRSKVAQLPSGTSVQQVHVMLQARRLSVKPKDKWARRKAELEAGRRWFELVY